MTDKIDWATMVETISPATFITPASGWTVLAGECYLRKMGRLIFGTLVLRKDTAIASTLQETAGDIAAEYRPDAIVNTFGASGTGAYSVTAPLYAYFGNTGLIVRAVSGSTDKVAKVNFCYATN